MNCENLKLEACGRKSRMASSSAVELLQLACRARASLLKFEYRGAESRFPRPAHRYVPPPPPSSPPPPPSPSSPPPPHARFLRPSRPPNARLSNPSSSRATQNQLQFLPTTQHSRKSYLPRGTPVASRPRLSICARKVYALEKSSSKAHAHCRS
ncbi:hypothetical protein GALMADRAFT_806019 [Galerina marginata CBS 339.88]|uniref:Uncharacterized protein n=1 Tax=Galerina marginata (strain CBS 339.88) TaxID=685588 RepID=A0A067SJN5_GALM3|nr:hypothetical protein GALMADRAFT_806019 [Galerina marginata CBS 339.88]